MRVNNLGQLIVAILFSQAAGLIGSLFTTPAIAGWYKNLAKPDLAPPNWVFGPVWTTLFLLMGVASYLIWQKGLQRFDVKIALGLFLFQLLLNIIWSVLFFGYQSPGSAFVEIILLWLSILATIIAFKNIVPLAGWLLVPYILWVSFASYLNYSIWRLN